MVNNTLQIGIIGCGSRGLSIIERILSLSENGSERPVTLNIFDPNPFGCGVHSLDQPDYLLLNTIAGQLGVFPDVASLGGIPGAKGRSGMSFLTWCHAQKINVDPESGGVAQGGRAVEAEDFLPRRLLGEYLVFAFEQIIASAPPHVQVRLHAQAVVKIDQGRVLNYCLTTDNGKEIEVENLILTLGHTGRERIQQSEHIAPIYPLPASVDSISSDESVIVEGMGLGAMDVVAALTSGRGGVYKRLPGGEHIYYPSGKEPLIFLQSREGVPFRVRPDGLATFPRHQAVVLTSERIDLIRNALSQRQLNFKQDIVPLMLIEMRAAAAAVKFSAGSLPQHKAFLNELTCASQHEITGIEDCELLLTEYEKRLGGIDVETLLHDQLPASVSAVNYHAWLCETIEADLHEANRGLWFSPQKAALEVWRDLRDKLREIVDFNGLDKHSHRQFYRRWHKIINRAVAGPQKERHADLMALCDAGLLTFLYPGAVMGVSPHKRISAYVHGSGILNSDSLPIQSLKRMGLVRPFFVEEGLDGVDINSAYHPLSHQGIAVKSLWVIGPLTEGACYYNHYVASAGAPSRLFMDAHRIANQLLQSATEAVLP